MPMTSPDRIELSPAQRRELTGALRAGRSEQRLAQRARIVLLAAQGLPNAEIGRRVGVSRPTVIPELLTW